MRLTLVCGVIRYRLVQVRRNLKKRILLLSVQPNINSNYIIQTARLTDEKSLSWQQKLSGVKYGNDCSLIMVSARRTLLAFCKHLAENKLTYSTIPYPTNLTHGQQFSTSAWVRGWYRYFLSLRNPRRRPRVHWPLAVAVRSASLKLGSATQLFHTRRLAKWRPRELDFLLSCCCYGPEPCACHSERLPPKKCWWPSLTVLS